MPTYSGSGSQNVFGAQDGLLAISEEVITTYGTVEADSTFKIVPCTGPAKVKIANRGPNDTGLTYSKGTAARNKSEYFKGKGDSSFSIPTILDDVLAAYALTSLFQHGAAVSGTSPKVYTETAWKGQPTAQSSLPTKYKGLSVRKIFGGVVASACHQVAGGIISSIKISGEAGGVMSMTLEGMGLAGSVTTVTTLPTTLLAGAGRLLFDNMSLKIGGTAFIPLSFDITLSNNLIVHYGQSTYPTDPMLQWLSVSGSLRFPTKASGITRLTSQLAGTSERLFLQWGTTTMTDASGTWGSAGSPVAGSLAIGCDAEWGNTEEDEASGISVLNLPFTMMEGTNIFQAEVDTATTLTVAV